MELNKDYIDIICGRPDYKDKETKEICVCVRGQPYVVKIPILDENTMKHLWHLASMNICVKIVQNWVRGRVGSMGS